MTLKIKYGRLNLLLISILGLICISNSLSLQVSAASFTNPAFERVWNRTDRQVSAGQVSRTYLWGPEPFTTGIQEDYKNSPGGKRLVQYFDKSRMEINDPQADESNPFFVTNGLIARELITGQLQLGDSLFEKRQPADIGVAGDIDDTSGPTYKALNNFTEPTVDDTGSVITQAIDREGFYWDEAGDFSHYDVTQGQYERTTGHNIALPFWNFLNQTGPVQNQKGQVVNGRLFDPVFYATGLPITDAWWAKVKVGGVLKDVLVQAYERRVLTYTPSNPAAFRVEMGNVGRHYYLWRYGKGTTTTATPTPTPTRTPTPTATTSAGVDIIIQKFSFKPQTITVTVGTTVRWINRDNTTHTVTADNGLFDSDKVASGETFSFIFKSGGTFSYHSNLDREMSGIIVVTG